MTPYDRRGSKNPKWKGGICFDRNRKMIYSPNHPRCMNGVYVYEYILIAEEMLGRYLAKGEIVHHKNGDQTDNRPDNLEVITQSDHIKLHMKELHNEKWKKNLNAIHAGKRDAKGRFGGV
jgi:hypothetical protein